MNRKKRRGRNTASVSKDAAIDTDNTHTKTISDVKLTSEPGGDFNGTNGKQPQDNNATADEDAENKSKTSGPETEINQQAHCIAACRFNREHRDKAMLRCIICMNWYHNLARKTRTTRGGGLV